VNCGIDGLVLFLVPSLLLGHGKGD
jgi:hypothetical protein